MPTDPHIAGERLLVRKSFTHGRITVDTNRSEIVFGSHPALPLPAGFAIDAGRQLIFALSTA